MKQKYRRGIDMVDKHVSQRKYTSLGLLLIVIATLVSAGQVSATSAFNVTLQSVYGNASCGVCHIDPSGGGERTAYGNLFESQPDFSTDPKAALLAIGAPPASEITDIISPTTMLSGVTENGSYNNSVTVTLNATDNGSGVNETFYIINGGENTLYSVPFVVDTVGPNNITYWSTDKAGNVEPQNMVNFTIVNISIDTLPPVTTSDVTENGSYNNSVTVTLNATDNGSGVNETFYIINGGENTLYSVPFVVDTIGLNNITYWSTDKAGNVESPIMVNFTIVNISTDTLPPVTTSNVIENGSYNNSVTVTLNATDNGSGVNKTFYMVNDGKKKTYSKPFVVDNIGPNNITYWSTDMAGNVESTIMVNFTIVKSIEDTLPPVTTSDVTENGSYIDNVTVTLNATDNGSGVNETFYMINGGTTTTYSAPFVVDTLGQDNLTYWSTDKAGNVESQNMVNFTIVKETVNATATRKIKSKSILPGESTIITVNISGNSNALALHEIPPDGWNVSRGEDNADDFKNSTNEWVWKGTQTDKTVTYTLTAPDNISIGTYQIEGTIRDANGILANVEGDNSVKIDILEVYRRLGEDPGVVETGDLLRAFDDFRTSKVPQGFDRPLSEEEVVELINEWRNS